MKKKIDYPDTKDIVINKFSSPLYHSPELTPIMERHVTNNDAFVAGDYNNYGDALYSQGQYQQALVAYKYAINLNDKYADAYNGLGRTLLELKQNDKALGCFYQAIQCDPKHSAAHYNMGMSFSIQGEFDKAATSYQNAISLNPEDNTANYAVAYFNMGGALYMRGNFDEAIIAYQKAIKLVSDYQDAYAALSIVFKAQGKNNLAKIANEQKSHYETYNVSNGNFSFKFQNNIIQAIDIIKSFKDLDTYNLKLKFYCKIFYCITLNLFGGYKLAKVQFKAYNKFNEYTAENDQSINISAAVKTVKFGTDLIECRLIPAKLLKLIDKVIDCIYDTVKEQATDNKAEGIRKIVSSQFGSSKDINVSINVAKIALAMAMNKSKISILQDDDQIDLDKVNPNFKWLHSQINQLKNEFVASLIFSEEDGLHRVIQDVILFLTYLAKNYRNIINSTERLEKQCENIAWSNELKMLLINSSVATAIPTKIVEVQMPAHSAYKLQPLAKTNEKISTPTLSNNTALNFLTLNFVKGPVDSIKINSDEYADIKNCCWKTKEMLKKCTIFSVYNIHYNNPLLNNATMFNELVKILGHDKILSVGDKLTKAGYGDIMSQFIQNNDYHSVYSILVSDIANCSRGDYGLLGCNNDSGSEA